MEIIKKDCITEEYYDTVSKLLYQHNLHDTKNIDSINEPLEIVIFNNDRIIGGLYGHSI
ncbi:hypothetical protein [Chryseobacterium pennae]|uniref:hypothetical protein n=1 Tax=Chryseobacterium pennae TaxID=2258962 RepID=UPI001E47E518|nr:hypothetical protein [Chryseobacterium pennae]